MKYVQIYREKEKRVTEPIVITTENVVELEDGLLKIGIRKKFIRNNMVCWNYRFRDRSVVAYNEGGSSWWATRNALTTSQRSGVSCYYTSYSGTVPVG